MNGVRSITRFVLTLLTSSGAKCACEGLSSAKVFCFVDTRLLKTFSQAHYNSATGQRIPTQDVSFNWVDMWGHLWPPTPIAKMQWFSGTRTLCRWSRMLLDIKIPEQGSSAAAKSMIWVCAHIVTSLISLLSQTKRSAEQCTKQSQSTEAANCSLKTLGWTNLTSSIHGKCWSFSKTSIMCR